jgi:release factor glutamine methyltransferase
MSETAPARPVPTIGAALKAARAQLTQAGVDAPARDAKLLLGHALSRPQAGLIGADRDPLGSEDAARFQALIDRRAAREPISRIIGTRAFWSLDFMLSEAVLDPRPDSECLVAAALAIRPERHAPLRIVDLGVGSGCLLLSVLAERPQAHGVGIDRAAGSVQVARQNADALGLGERALITQANWADCLTGPVDLVLSNPPYIPEADVDRLAPEVQAHDPRGALAGGADGLDAYRAILPSLPRLLGAIGTALLEVGAGQWNAVATMAEENGLAITDCARDAAGVARVVIVRNHRGT